MYTIDTPEIKVLTAKHFFLASIQKNCLVAVLGGTVGRSFVQ